MKIIAFEGIDACGKETQTELLTNWLREQGYSVFSESFPRYGTLIGEIIKSYLGDNLTLNDEAAAMLLEVDKQNFQTIIHGLEKAGYDFIVLDRYTLSNLAYGAAKGLDIDWLRELQKKIRKSDITFILDVSPETSIERKSVGRDTHEQDIELLERARIAYSQLADSFRNEGDLIFKIDGERSIDEIHSEIIEVLKERLL